MIQSIEYAGNCVNKQGTEPQGLAEAMGVNVEADYDYYDPYAMEDGTGQFEQVGGDMAMLIQEGQKVTSSFLSYSGGQEEEEEEEATAVAAARPKSRYVSPCSLVLTAHCSLDGSSGSKKARPKSGRPGSAGKKKRDKKDEDVHLGIPSQSEEKDKSQEKNNVPKARGLVAKRPPSARVRASIPT